jgi:hypothetical protein
LLVVTVPSQAVTATDASGPVPAVQAVEWVRTVPTEPY